MTDRTDKSQYLLRMSPEQKARLKDKSQLAGVSLSEALRVGGEAYLDQLLEAHTPTSEQDPLLSQFRAIAFQVESRLRES